MFNNPDPTIFAPDESVENAEPQRVFLLRVDVIETATGKVGRRRAPWASSCNAGSSASSAPSPPMPAPCSIPCRKGFSPPSNPLEAAIHGACDMQRCCAAIPQIPGTRVGIRIGIDVGPADHSEATTTSSASRMAMLGGMDAIILSNAIADELGSPLRQKASRLTDADGGIAAYSLDWKNTTLPPLKTTNDTPKSKKAAPARTTHIVLRMGGKALSFRDSRRVITIGRDAGNDISVDNPEASRKHCRIVIQHESYVLVDQSTNGTYLTPDEGTPRYIKHKMATLNGAGWIAFGHPHDRSSDNIVEFRILGVTS
jgi:adenylate cyclase